jgi:tRNA 2-thiouridine synthesizing protein A
MSELSLTPTQRTVDARGLNCPLPILRTKKVLSEMSAGEILEVVATDPHSVRDFEAFCKQTGHTLVSTSKGGDEFKFILKRK